MLIILIQSFNLTLNAQDTLVLQPDANCGKDAILHGLNSEVNTNFGDNQQMPVTSWTFSGIHGDVRSIIDFDLSSIPTGSVINGAFLSLYAWPHTTGMGQHSSLSGSNASWIKRVTSPWNENTVTWNTQPSSTVLNQVILPQSTSPTQDYLNVNVTNLVQDMLINQNSSYGFILSLQTEEVHRRLNFCSSDYPNPMFHPKLEVIYTISSSPPNNIVSLGADTTLCQDEILVLDVSNLNATYLWQDNSTNPTFNVTQQGTYWVEVTTCSMVFSDTINVAFNPLPIIDLGNDTTLCEGEVLTLDASTTNATYLWQDNSTNPTLDVTQQGTYSVTTTANNCSASDAINVNYIDCDSIVPIADIIIPTAFTPNEDNANDLWDLVHLDALFPENKVFIYNRWGNLIYESIEGSYNQMKWDGTFKGELLPIGTYYFIIDYNDGVKESSNGMVSIIK